MREFRRPTTSFSNIPLFYTADLLWTWAIHGPLVLLGNSLQSWLDASFRSRSLFLAVYFASVCRDRGSSISLEQASEWHSFNQPHYQLISPASEWPSIQPVSSDVFGKCWHITGTRSQQAMSDEEGHPTSGNRLTPRYRPWTVLTPLMVLTQLSAVPRHQTIG